MKLKRVCAFYFNTTFLSLLNIFLQLDWTFLALLLFRFAFANLSKSVDLPLLIIFCRTFYWRYFSKPTKLILLVSLHEEVCIDFNLIYSLLLFLSLSLCISPKVLILMHLMQIYERFRPCYFEVLILFWLVNGCNICLASWNQT